MPGPRLVALVADALGSLDQGCGVDLLRREGREAGLAEEELTGDRAGEDVVGVVLAGQVSEVLALGGDAHGGFAGGQVGVAVGDDAAHSAPPAVTAVDTQGERAEVEFHRTG